MASSYQTEMTLPARSNMELLVRNYVLALGDLAGLSREEAESLAQAVWLACLNAIDYAYEADERGTLRLAGEITPASLSVAVHDLGLPYYYTLEPSTPSAATRRVSQGRSLAAIQSGADETRLLNHGKDGNELRLKKYLTGLCRLDYAGNESKSPPAAQPEGSSGYTVRLLRPADSVQVAQLMYRVYGYSYSNEDFYFPDRLAHDLETGRHVGVVAQTADGEIVGHVGVERSETNQLAELGQLAVAPSHRGQGLRDRMGDCLQEEIRHLDLVGLFAEAVTIHTISQAGSENRGLHLTGIKLLDWQAQFKKRQSFCSDRDLPETDAADSCQRETMVYYFKYLSRPKPFCLYAPPRHRRMLEKLYANLDAPAEVIEPGSHSGHGQLVLHHDKALKVGSIQVNHSGRDILAGISQACQDLSDIAGAEVVGLYLPLAQPGTAFLCEAVEKLGFFFSGVQPHFTLAGDFLRLQRLNVPLNTERIHLASSAARELLEYVLADRRRVQKL